MRNTELLKRTVKESDTNTNPDSCEFCPFVDLEKTDDEYAFCEILQMHFKNTHNCTVSVKSMEKYMKEKHNI